MRWLTPYSSMPMPGVEMHANTFETIVQNRFLTDAPAWSVVVFCILLVAAAGSIFTWLSGWKANLAAAGVLGAAHVVPYVAFTGSTVFPFSPGVSTAWFSIRPFSGSCGVGSPEIRLCTSARCGCPEDGCGEMSARI